MSSSKSPMSASYKVIFVLSILMIFVVIISGAISGSKSVGLGVWIWGYTAWLMFKRKNTELVSFYKLLLWFYVIAAVVAVTVLSLSDNDVSRYVGYTSSEVILLFVFVLSLTYGIYKYFFGLVSNPTAYEPFNVADSTIWDQVTAEVKMGKRVDSLWTRAFSESDGDSNKANARYIKWRFDQIKSEMKATSNVTNVGISAKKSSNVKFTVFDFWNNFNTVGKLALIGIFLLILYSILGGDMDPYFQSQSSYKDNVTSSNSISQHTSSTKIVPKSSNCIFVWSEPQRIFLKIDDDIYDSANYTNTFIIKIGKEAYTNSLLAQLRKADAENNVPLAKSIAKEIRANALTVYFEKKLTAEFIKLIAEEQNLRSQCL